MIYVVGGLALAICYTAAALGIAIWQSDLSLFVDITMACDVSLSPLDQCREAAIAVGRETLAGLSLAALMLLTALFVERGQQGVKRWALPPNTFERSILHRAFLIGVAGLLIAHIMVRITGPLQVGRLAMLTQEAHFASLENLSWPLLLQLYVADRSRLGRYLALALVLAIASLTFYRGMLLTVLVFGVGLYTLDIVWRMLQQRRHWRRYLPILIERSLVGLVVTFLLLSAAKSDSDSRKTAIAATASTTEQHPISSQQLRQQQILQRITSPIYQASLAEKLAASNELPTLQDGLARKFRLSDAPNLNEYLYRTLYTYSPVGQTTSLTYGEAAAWSSAPPLIWVVSIVLLFASLAVGGRRLALPIGLLVGLALWRGFIGGTLDILPSLALQLVAMIMIVRIQLSHGATQ